MEIKVDDLSDPRIGVFLDEHIKDMRSVSPPESKHALDLEGLKKQDVTFWSVWDGSKLIGCGAIQELNSAHAEIKSMRVSANYRRRGVASKLLDQMIEAATAKGYYKLSLETGSMAFFVPARKLYERYGFKYCPPFANYIEDPNSMFMTLELNGR